MSASDATAQAIGFPYTERILGVLGDAWQGSVFGPTLDGGGLIQGRFQLEWASPEGVSALRERIADLAPDVLIIDADWLGHVDAEDFAQLRRERGGLHWMLAAAGSHTPQLELVIRCQACGLIDWHADAATFARAMDAVLRGEFWFGRALMQQLYVCLLEAGQAGSANVDGTACTLSPREAQALVLVRQGLSNKQIAARLGVSINTVKKHVAHAFEKAGVHHRRQLHD